MERASGAKWSLCSPGFLWTQSLSRREKRTTRKDLHVCVVDTDWGIGVVKRNDFFDTKLVQNHNEFYEFNIMDANREEDLGLISIEEFLQDVG